VSLMGRGGMVSVALPESELDGWLERWGGAVSVAAVNGPGSVVVSGERGALDGLLGELEAGGVRAREIPVGYASHSVQIEEIRAELLEGCAGIASRSGDVPFLSTVTGELVDTATLDGAYWYRNLRDTVRFEQAIESLLGEGYRAFVEVGPHPVLTMAVQETAEDPLGREAFAAADGGGVLLAGSLRRDDGGLQRFLTSLGEVWVHGVDVDWDAVYAGSQAERVGLPTYAFQRERYWLAGAGAGDAAAVGLTRTDHPLLGAAVGLADGSTHLFTGRLSLRDHAWLADHAVMGAVLLPGAAFLEMAFYAGSEVGCEVVRELVIEAPLLLPEDGAVQLQLTVGEPEESGARSLHIYSRADSAAEDTPEAWTRHAQGTLAPAVSANSATVPSTTAPRLASTDPSSSQSLANGTQAADFFHWPPPGAQPVELDGLYDRLAEAGLEYGPAFQGLMGVWSRGDELFAEVSLPESEHQRARGFALHPALLDAALHALGMGLLDVGLERGRIGLPFSWVDARVGTAGASSLRLRLLGAEAGKGEVSLLALDDTGALVMSVAALAVRPVSAEQLARAPGARQDALLTVDWVAVSPVQADGGEPWAVLGDADGLLAGSLGRAGACAGAFADLDSFGEAVEGGLAVPGLVFLDCTGEVETGATRAGADSGLPQAAGQAVREALGVLQAWLGDERFESSRLVLVTREAVAVGAGDEVGGLERSGVWGLVRSAQSENPGRLGLLDIDRADTSMCALPSTIFGDEPQLAVRHGVLSAPRLTRAGSDAALVPPAGEPFWRLQAARTGTLEGLQLAPAPAVAESLGGGEVRVGVRAAGLNFRDVLIALGVYPGEALMGGEGAGVVLDVGPEVQGLAPGDRVMGLLAGAFGPVAVTDQRLLAPIPPEWSFATAAAMPTVFLTVYYGLVDLAALTAGERVLIHAGAGGVGMAAVQLAHHLGAEVFATASPAKWDALRALGLDEMHIASSRTLEFKDKFSAATGGEGVDVVLNSLTREYVDASLALLPRGGRFIEMGKTDVRDPHEIAEHHARVVYRAFDLSEAGPQRIHEMLTEILALFERGALRPLPLKTWDLRHAPEAFRRVSQARHIGKNVLTLPTTIDPRGTVLIAGGTGQLGSVLARHLVQTHGVAGVLLASRQGPDAVGASELQSELLGLGADVTIAACDLTSREDVQRLLDLVPAERPLTAVIHAAGALDDGVIGSLTPERLDRVLAPKIDAAWHLHELTRHLDLQAFVLYSSAAGVLGTPGQGNYAAANAFLDALAARRRAQGLAATSLAWGLWGDPSGMTGHLQDVDRARMARLGIDPLSTHEGLELFDSAYAGSHTLTVPARLDNRALHSLARSGALPALLRRLIREPARRARSGSTGSLARTLAGVPESEREQVVRDLVRAEVAAVLGYASKDAIAPERTFTALGVDSLAGIEVRNRIARATGLPLAATLIFDYPNCTVLAAHLRTRLQPDASEDPREVEMRRAIASLPLASLRSAGLLDTLLELVSRDEAQGRAVPAAAMAGRNEPDRIEDMDVEGLLQRALGSTATEGAATESAGAATEDGGS